MATVELITRELRWYCGQNEESEERVRPAVACAPRARPPSRTGGGDGRRRGLPGRGARGEGPARRGRRLRLQQGGAGGGAQGGRRQRAGRHDLLHGQLRQGRHEDDVYDEE